MSIVVLDMPVQVEACDVVSGFLLLQSMAGGTGAGLGTYIATALRDEYPVTHALNCCVWPYESGEVIVQACDSCDGSQPQECVPLPCLHLFCVWLHESGAGHRGSM